MLYTLTQAREKVKAFVDGGSCSTTKINGAINEALERLMAHEAWDTLTVSTRIGVCNAAFPLPYNAEGILACCIDGTPAKVFGRHYQFLHSGPGDLDYRGSASCYRDLVDMGDYPVMYDLPHIYEHNPGESTSTTVASAPGAGDISVASRTLTLTLTASLGISVGDTVTIQKTDASTFVATVSNSSSAPTYTFTWATTETDAPSAHTELSTSSTVTRRYTASASTTVDATAGLKIAAFCTEAADVDKELKIYGFKDGALTVRTGTTEGETISIKRWSGGEVGTLAVGVVDDEWVDNVDLTATAFTDISRVVKAETDGPVYLYAIDESTNRMFFLACYTADQTIPQFRRYRVTNKTANTSVAHVYALLKLRYVPLSSDTDILPIESLQALKLMVMAISEENKMQLPMAQALEEKAVAVLAKKEESKQMTTGTPVILDSDYRTSLGARMNRRIII